MRKHKPSLSEGRGHKFESCRARQQAVLTKRLTSSSPPRTLIGRMTLSPPCMISMPLILDSRDYDQWLDKESDPADLIRPFSADQMVTWPVSTRVNKPENDDATIPDRLAVGKTQGLRSMLRVATY